MGDEQQREAATVEAEGLGGLIGGRHGAPERTGRGRRNASDLVWGHCPFEPRGNAHAGPDAGLPAHAAALLRPGRAAVRRQGGRHRDGRRASSARRTASGPSAPAGSAACSTTSASPTTAGSRRSRWNTARHLELYFAAPCTGRVLHTLNIRLFPEQLTYIVNHAEDEVIFVDRSLTRAAVAAARHVRDRAPPRRDGRRQGRRARRRRRRSPIHDYEELLAAAAPVEFERRRREPGRVDVLHERHDRQPEGRRVLATARRSCTRWAR